jgi:hypothetical protein
MIGRIMVWLSGEVAASLLDMEQRFKRIMGYPQLWMLEVKVKEFAQEDIIDGELKVA